MPVPDSPGEIFLNMRFRINETVQRSFTANNVSYVKVQIKFQRNETVQRSFTANNVSYVKVQIKLVEKIMF